MRSSGEVAGARQHLGAAAPTNIGESAARVEARVRKCQSLATKEGEARRKGSRPGAASAQVSRPEPAELIRGSFSTGD